ncbi:FAD-dependent oxidoreductase [Pseudalkalibacillus berkeleyi]|uniref:FAD-dependent oxidoreductase n=1 Tax=Pseudalkalibacillus berkeleyi TaxID=1069813 RepID=A0ABS9H0R8_9BACL|nr:FAD-dependent oxidoreductase [Pseudalkalibacillus berkeleyi]MCF6138534.1 FAD-dependent oxidoreductase [Pseudalkalibacillus berkeleyi]
MNRNNKRINTQETIVKAALELFYEKGYANTSIKEITDKAKIAKGTFFNYFPTKEDLMQHYASERLHTLSIFLEKGYILSQPFQKQMEVLVGHLLTYYDLDSEFTKDLWATVFRDNSPLIECWMLILNRASLRGEISASIDLVSCAHVCNSHFHYVLSTSSKDDTKKSLIQRVMTLMDLSIEGFHEKRGNDGMKKLVILGAGYGGMKIVQGLLDSSDLPKDIQITLVDRLPYHCLKTEYYALAAGTVSDHHIRVAFPEDSRVIVKYGEVSEIDLKNKSIHFEKEDIIEYDDLIIGLGCEDKYHGVPGAPENTLSIQTIDKSRETYQHLNNLPPKAVVGVVGGGLSGVELASELHESRPDLQIKLFDRGETILSTFPKRLSNYVQKWFVDHGVEVVNESNITKVDPKILYNKGEPVPCDAIVWTAGIQPNRIVRNLDVEKDNSGRIVLSPHHHLPDDPHVFVVGDCASLPHAPSAQLAEGQGDQIVEVLLKLWKDEPVGDLPKIKLKGVLGSLGKKHGFGMMKGTALTGRVPRLLKSGILWMYKYHSN